jgi:hypothetical protein
MSFIGAATGLVLIYFVPLIVNMVYYDVKHPETDLREKIINYESSSDSNKNTIYSNVFQGPHIISKKKPSKLKDILFYISQALIMIFGILTLTIQFVKFNIFKIHLE